MRSSFAVAFLSASLLLPSCGNSGRHGIPVANPRPVFIEVEVYDPYTNVRLPFVEVRIVEASLEWSGLTLQTSTGVSTFTGRDGIAYLDEFLIADSQVGFVESASGAALLEPQTHRDEATVVIELYEPGYAPAYYEVDLSWFNSDVLVFLPY